jgi:hypothetical protein
MANAYHEELLAELERAAGPGEPWEGLQHYLGTSKRCYPIKSGERGQVVKAFLARHRDLSLAEYTGLIGSLCRGESFDEIAMAGALLRFAPRLRKQLDPGLLVEWLGGVEGWAETDSLCMSHFTAQEVLARWDDWHRLLTRLAVDGNVHRRRASLVLLTKAVRDAADERLADLAFANIDRLRGERHPHHQGRLVALARARQTPPRARGRLPRGQRGLAAAHRRARDAQQAVDGEKVWLGPVGEIAERAPRQRQPPALRSERDWGPRLPSPRAQRAGPLAPGCTAQASARRWRCARLFAPPPSTGCASNSHASAPSSASWASPVGRAQLERHLWPATACRSSQRVGATPRRGATHRMARHSATRPEQVRDSGLGLPAMPAPN